jgi:hypothetical protein
VTYVGFARELFLGLHGLVSGADTLSWHRRLCFCFLVAEA